MPYITAQEVAAKRKEIKEAFPGWKFSIVREHHSGIRIDIMEAPIKMTEQKYESVNHFYIAKHYENQPEIKEALLKIYGIACKGVRTLVEDADYGTVPTFYTWMGIGSYDRPFKFIHGAVAFKLKSSK